MRLTILTKFVNIATVLYNISGTSKGLKTHQYTQVLFQMIPRRILPPHVEKNHLNSYRLLLRFWIVYQALGSLFSRVRQTYAGIP